MLGQIDHADTVRTNRWQLDIATGQHLTEEFVGNLEKDAGAIAGINLTATSAAVIKINQHRQRLANDCMRLFAFNINHETNATCISLESWIIQPLLRRRSNDSMSGIAFHDMILLKRTNEPCTCLKMAAYIRCWYA